MSSRENWTTGGSRRGRNYVLLCLVRIAVPGTSKYAEVSNMGQPTTGVMRTIRGEVRYVAENLSRMQGLFDEVFHS